MVAVFVSSFAHVFDFTRCTEHIPIHTRLPVEQFLLLPGIDLACHLKIDLAMAAHLTGTSAVGQDVEVAQIGFFIVGLVYLCQPYQRLDNRTVRAGMLRIVAWSPRNASILFSIGIETAVPSVNAVVGKILCLRKIVVVASQLVGTHHLTTDPHLVVIDILNTRDGGCALGVGTMHPVDAPLGDAGIGVEGVGASVVVERIEELLEPFHVSLPVVIIELRCLFLEHIQCLNDRAVCLYGCGVGPHISRTTPLLGFQIIEVVHTHVRSATAEGVLHRRISHLYGTF